MTHFAFDLDSTITRCELLPLIAQQSGLGDEMARLTEAAMQGNEPFEQDFPSRVDLLKSVPVSKARRIVQDAPLNEEIVRFIRAHAQRCTIVTGNLDAWIAPLIEKLGMKDRCLCSRGITANDRLRGISFVLNKERACRILPRPFVAIGDGSNDADMLRLADVGIAFGGVRAVPESLVAAADMVVKDEKELIGVLNKLL